MHKIIEVILGFVGHWSTWILALLFLPKGRGGIAVEAIQRILVFGTVGIGNMVLYTPFVRALRKHFPRAHITLVFFADKRGAERVLLRSNLADENHAWIVSELSHLQMFKLLPELIVKRKRWKADLVVSRYNTRFIGYNLITLLSGARYRIGHVYNDRWNSRSDYLYNYPVIIDEDEPEERMYLRLGKDIGFHDEDAKPVFYINSADEEHAREFLASRGIDESHRILAMQVGTSRFQKWKNWGRDKWIHLIQCLLEEDIRIAILGIAGEWDEIKDGFSKEDPRLLVGAGVLTLQQSAAVVKRSSLMVSSDSCMMHIAAAMDVPTVAIFGPTSHRITAPSGRSHTVIRKDLPCSPCYFLRSQNRPENCKRRLCLDSIEVTEVLDAVMNHWRQS